MVALGRALLPIPGCCFATRSASAWRPLVVNELYALIPDIKRAASAFSSSSRTSNASLAVADRFYCLLEGKVSLAGRPAETSTARS